MAQAPECLLQFGRPPKQLGKFLDAQFECEHAAKDDWDTSFGGNDELPGTPSFSLSPYRPAFFGSDSSLLRNCALSSGFGGRPMLCIRKLNMRRCKREEVNRGTETGEMAHQKEENPSHEAP